MNVFLVIWHTLVGCAIGIILLFLVCCALLGIDPKEQIKNWFRDRINNNKTPK